MHYKKIIIGGGMTGLILSFYLKIPMLGEKKKLGGWVGMKDWDVGPRYFKVDDDTEDLLKRLNLSREKEDIRVGYYNKEYCEPDEEFRQRYYEKTRKTKDGYTSSSMNGGKRIFKSFTIDFKKVVGELKKELFKNPDLFIDGNIKTINPEMKTIKLNDEAETTITYEEAIWTLPATEFKDKATIPIEANFKALSKVFVLVKEEPDTEHNFVYVADESPWHRITNQGNRRVYEFTDYEPGTMPNEIDRVKMSKGQIQENSNGLSIEGITFVGRYAQWTHKFLVNDTIKAARKLSEEEKWKN